MPDKAVKAAVNWKWKYDEAKREIDRLKEELRKRDAWLGQRKCQYGDCKDYVRVNEEIDRLKKERTNLSRLHRASILQMEEGIKELMEELALREEGWRINMDLKAECDELERRFEMLMKYMVSGYTYPGAILYLDAFIELEPEAANWLKEDESE